MKYIHIFSFHKILGAPLNLSRSTLACQGTLVEKGWSRPLGERLEETQPKHILRPNSQRGWLSLEAVMCLCHFLQWLNCEFSSSEANQQAVICILRFLTIPVEVTSVCV